MNHANSGTAQGYRQESGRGVGEGSEPEGQSIPPGNPPLPPLWSDHLSPSWRTKDHHQVNPANAPLDSLHVMRT
jgi:hypothetical protein